MKAMIVAAATLLIAGAAAADVTKTSLDAPEKAADKQDKMICKTTPVIGSLVATDKVCRTKREWEKTRSNLWQRGGTGMCAGPGGQGGGTCQ